MLGPYLDVLRRPGAAAFSAAGFLGRMQLAMTGLASVMLLSVVRDSYAVAGTVSAIFALSSAAVSPQFSRLIDVHGQRRVVPFQLGVHVPCIGAMIAVALATRLDWPLYVLALVAGATSPMVGTMVRTRWSALLGGTPALRTAYAWESLVDEIVFIVGPPLAVVVAQQVFPSAALLLAMIFLTVGTLLLLTQRRTEPTPSGRVRARGGRPAILLPGVAGVAAVFVMLGGVFGSFEVTTVAFATAAGQRGAGGVVLALYAFGSLTAGFVFGTLHLRSGFTRQLVVTTALLAVTTAPLPFLPSVWWVGLGLFVAGLACSPSLIAGTALLESIVPAHRLTETITWSVSGMAVGVAGATPLAGAIIDRAGASTAYWVTSGCAVLAAVLALVFAPTLHRAARGAERAPDDVLAEAERAAADLPVLTEIGASTPAGDRAARR